MAVRMQALVIEKEFGFFIPVSHTVMPGREAVLDHHEVDEPHEYVSRGNHVLFQLLSLAGDEDKAVFSLAIGDVYDPLYVTVLINFAVGALFIEPVDMGSVDELL